MPDTSASGGQDRAAIAADTARWFARRDAGWSDAEEAACARWRAADARHEEEWRRLDAAMNFVAAERDADDRGALVVELARRARQRRQRRAALATAGLAVAVVATGLLFRQRSLQPEPDTDAVARIQLAKPEHRSLPDGSTVDLARGAEIRVEFSPGRRSVDLLRGEAHFAVAKDATRPFVVTVGRVEVRAVGTEFAVRLADEAVRVLVTEGRIAVAEPQAAAAAPTACFADAGHRVTIAAGAAAVPLAAEAVAPADLALEQAWRMPTIELDGAPLSEVAAVFNRDNPVQLHISDPKLAGMRLTGVFRADQPLVFVRVLETHYGIRAERVGTTVHLRPGP